jgi:Family of unknown function (DUF6492)
MPHHISFVTVTHQADLGAFQLLRRSLRMFAPGIPHVVIVDDEQFAFYRDTFASEPNMTLLSSRSVLPERWERTRKKVRRSRGSLLEKVVIKLGFETYPFSGWCLQQLLKMHHLAASQAEVVVFLDSDLLLTRPFEPDSLFEQGKLVLPETPALSVEDHGFEVSTRVMLGESRGKLLEGYAYIHQPPRFYTRTGRTLLEALTRANAPVPWEYRFIRQQWPSEYHLLGFAARSLESAEGYCIRHFDTQADTYEVRFAKDIAAMEEVFNLCVNERGRRGYLLVQSNLRVHSDALLARLGRLLDELEGLHAR